MNMNMNMNNIMLRDYYGDTVALNLVMLSLPLQTWDVFKNIFCLLPTKQFIFVNSLIRSFPS